MSPGQRADRARRGGWRPAAWVAGAVGLAAVVAVAATGVDLSADEPATRSTLPPGTATVTRGTLTETEKVSGTLSYGDETTLAGRGSGTVTWLPAEGSQIARGQAVYRRDDRPVPLLYGSLPFYRVLAAGAEGKDVKQLEQNLDALGYDGFTVDESLTPATADAIADWQDDLGLPSTGRLDPGQVVVARGEIRVAQRRTATGSAATGPILTYTATTRIVHVDLDVGKQHLVTRGSPASVTLPDDTTVAGTVTQVGTVAKVTASGQQSATTIDVEISLSDQRALGSLDRAPVSVSLVSQTKADVLTVPIAALLALAEGGYGVQVIQNGQTSYLAVTTGLFAGGRVEISGPGVVAGLTVGMPS